MGDVKKKEIFYCSIMLVSYGTGQVTLPKKWRKKFDTLHFKASMDGKKIVLEPEN